VNERGPFIWTASKQSIKGRTFTCDWCGHKTDFLGSQMGHYEMGWACRDCMKYGAPEATPEDSEP